ncbi:hypothetical protein IH824_20820 [candidate division KSB1 bacterium]|nr:hypothetical protein [candidate division KSB1 bacterium]
MTISRSSFEGVKTPAFIYDEKVLLADLEFISSVAKKSGCKTLYSPKACSIGGVIELISEYVDG